MKKLKTNFSKTEKFLLRIEKNMPKMVSKNYFAEITI